jgi:protein involved in sex pheromone biosynthesis
MAFPSDTALDLESAWANLRATAGRMKGTASAFAAAASITRRQVLDFANALADYLAQFNSYTAVPGLAAYAKTQVNDPNLDIAAEYTTMRTQLVATQDWIVNNFPATTGELRVYVFDGNKRFSDVILTAPQLSSFKSQLNSLIATVA